MHTTRYLAALFAALLSANSLLGAAADRDTVIDRHALRAPRQVEQSVASLARYLIKPARNDREKARAIYRWVTDRVAYNVKGYLAGDYGDNRTQAVLKNRVGVCEGYANLFQDLCRQAGLPVAKVYGSSKGFGYVAGQELGDKDHVWNAVKLDGTWRLVEATWGAGAINGTRFVKAFNPYYFLTPPDQLIFTHFPQKAAWQLLRPAISKSEFKKLPLVNPVLFQMGVTAAAVRKQARAKDFRKLVEAYGHPGKKISIRQAPLDGRLRAGAEYRFRIESPDIAEMAFFHEGKWVSLERKGQGFEGTFTAPQKGKVLVRGKFRGKGETLFWDILEYAAA
jgi:hypothetical protein